MVGRDKRSNDHPEAWSMGDGETNTLRSMTKTSRLATDMVDGLHNSLDAESLYLREIQSASLLTAEQECKLSILATRGDSTARERIIVSNLRLVVKIARGYHSSSMGLLDLVEEGNIGLINAVAKFDPAKNCRFSTYAGLWIRHEIERALMNKERTIRVPLHVMRELTNYRRLSKALMKTLQHEPSIGEESEQSQWTIDEISRFKRIGLRTKSIQMSLTGAESGLALFDFIVNTRAEDPVAQLQLHEIEEQLNQWLGCLDSRQREVIERRFGLTVKYGEPQTLDQVATGIGVGRESVRQIQLRALENLKSVLEKSGVFWEDVSRLE